MNIVPHAGIIGNSIAIGNIIGNSIAFGNSTIGKNNIGNNTIGSLRTSGNVGISENNKHTNNMVNCGVENNLENDVTQP